MWHVDALAVGQLATVEHFGIDGVCVLGGYPQAQLAVVEQQVHARLQRRDDFRVGQVDPAAVTRGLVQVQAQGLAALQLDLALGEAADAQLRPLQVHEDAQRVVQLLLDFADPLVAQGVVGVFAVAEVEAEDVNPGFDQLADVVDAFDRRAEGGEDLYFYQASWLGSLEDQDGAEVVDVGTGRLGDDQGIERGEVAIAVVVVQLIAGRQTRASARA